MQHELDDATKICRRCGLGKAMLLVMGSPPCGAVQLVPADDAPPPPPPRADQ